MPRIRSSYAYVGPWRSRSGPFWNAPFGAVWMPDDVADVDAVVAFFRGRPRRGGLTSSLSRVSEPIAAAADSLTDWVAPGPPSRSAAGM